MNYVLQHPDFGLGNFINITPALRWLHERTGERTPVFFSTDYVRQCFLDCPFIEILDEQPENGLLFGSNLVNPNDDKPDYQFVFEFVTGEKWTPAFHTYVDVPPINFYGRPEIVIINGAGNEKPDYVARKDPGEWAYRKVINDYFPFLSVCATGSEADYRRNKWMVEIASEWLFGDIRQALHFIASASFVIANDTGLAHAAAAMNKSLFVLLKDGPKERIKNPGANTVYLQV